MVLSMVRLSRSLKARSTASDRSSNGKKSVADSINIYADRRDGGGWKFLANDTIPDYIDTHEIPTGQNSAVWDYKARYRVGDEEVGKFSDVITITTTKNV